ncbi:hypothetical protein MTO96_013271 [Rhipicephalus appendiculatus]
MHEAVVASTTDAAANGHRIRLEGARLQLMAGPSMGLEHGVRTRCSNSHLGQKDGRRRVAMMNTVLVCDGSTVYSKPPEAYALHLAETTSMTPGFQEVVAGDATRNGGNLNRRSAVTSTDESGVKDESPKTKTPRLEVQKSGTAGTDGSLRGERRSTSTHRCGLEMEGQRYEKAHRSGTTTPCQRKRFVGA